MDVFFALCELSVGLAILIFALAECIVHALVLETTRVEKCLWFWTASMVFVFVPYFTIEAVFHTLGVPLA